MGKGGFFNKLEYSTQSMVGNGVGIYSVSDLKNEKDLIKELIYNDLISNSGYDKELLDIFYQVIKFYYLMNLII